MWTATFIRRHIFSLPEGTPFTTRDFLTFGLRAAVDQTLYRLVKSGTIQRLARGLFVRDPDNRKRFSDFEIASLKASAFGRKLARNEFGAKQECAVRVDEEESAFWINGRSSSFHIDGRVMQLKECCQRKMKLCEGKSGQRMKDLWRMGKQVVTRVEISHALRDFRRTDRLKLTRITTWMPAWLSDFFILPDYWPGPAVIQDGLCE
jgi:hypothetical protein